MTSTSSLGVMLPRDLPASQVLEYARRADRIGFDELWVVEDLGYRGGFAQAAAVLAVTERIRVGIGIVPAAVRNAAFTAMEIATLGQLFPGRIDVGIGHGMPEWMRQVGCWPTKPLALLSDYTGALRALLRGERFDGEIGDSSVSGVQLASSSLPASVPSLFLGVRGPRSLAASGRVADGTVLAEPCTPEYVRLALEQIAAAGPHRVVAYNVAAVNADPETAIQTARGALQGVGEPDWAPHVTPLPYAEELAALRRVCTDTREFVDRMPAEWVQELALAGTPDHVRSRIAELTAAGVDSNVLCPVGPDALGSLEQFATVL